METKTKNRRFIVILAIGLALLAGAVWLNLKLKDEGGIGAAAEATETPAAVQTAADVFGGYFGSFRDQRSKLRAEEIDYLRTILNSANSDGDAVADARERLVELVGSMEKEFTIESLIRSKGFLDAAATLRSGSATVVINGETLTDEEVARILDIVMGETGLPASAIKISLGGEGTADDQ